MRDQGCVELRICEKLSIRFLLKGIFQIAIRIFKRREKRRKTKASYKKRHVSTFEFLGPIKQEN